MYAFGFNIYNMNKTCSKCLIESSIDNFSKSKRGLFGRCSICKPCRNIGSVSYREINHDRISKNKKSHYQRNKSKINEKKKIYCKMKYKSDDNYKIKVISRGIIRRFIKYKGTKHTEDIIGCSFDDFKRYIESKFELWMSWDNYGRYNGDFNYGWDIDHITPVSRILNSDDYLKLNHYTNLQPLCSKVNRDVKRDIDPIQS